jgi:hypothetical protein
MPIFGAFHVKTFFQGRAGPGWFPPFCGEAIERKGWRTREIETFDSRGHIFELFLCLGFAPCGLRFFFCLRFSQIFNPKLFDFSPFFLRGGFSAVSLSTEKLSI